MFGEYKVPGGKLVTASLNVSDGKLANVQIAGDFFLEPGEALVDICKSVEGLPEKATVEDITTAIKQGVPPDTRFIGFTPESVAIAIRRALGVAKTWRDFEWQIIDPEPLAPSLHLAVDDVIAKEVAAGRRAPTLRFWEWDRRSVIIGSFQSLKNEVDLEAAKEHDVTIVRRMTGGGAMFQEPGASITYSVYAPAELVADMTFEASYAFLDSWVVAGLKTLGVNAVYQPLNDIASDKGKIGGAAQKRYHGGAVLHHTMMAYNIDAQKMMQVLRIGREKLSDKGTASAAKRVDPLLSQTQMEKADIKAHLIKTFIDLHGGAMGSITPEEMAAAEEIAAGKFSSKDWLEYIP
ncbi:MAG: lipoate--protein ligase family protein [Pseudomonadota bacterium]